MKDSITNELRDVPPPVGGRLGGGLSGHAESNNGPSPTLPLRGREFRRARFVAFALLIAFALSFTATNALAAWQTPNVSTQEMAEQQATPAPGITATVSAPYYKINGVDVIKAVATQLEQQGVVKKAEVTLNGGDQVVFLSADHALQVVIHALQVDPSTKRWQAQAYIMSTGKTEMVKPIGGFYGAMIDVPVLTRQFGQHDVIEATDIVTRAMPERQLRKETITDAKDLIGKSPRSAISADRPIRATEIAMPIVIKRGDAVEMTYTTQYMHIKTSGVALEDGAKGSLIRIKNDKSEKAVSGRVEAAGRVEVNSTADSM